LPEAQVVDLTRAPGFAPAEGILGRPIFGERAMVVLVTFEPGATAPTHAHTEEEQFGVVLTGELSVTIAGHTHLLAAGHAYYVPPGFEHAAVAGGDGCTGIEVFEPRRRDYLEALR
jgi:quercetin dioxygenase-like cupin family protein